MSIEDLKELFYVSYEMAAQRLTNLATRHLGVSTHFVRSDDRGRIIKIYENDGVPLPEDRFGGSEGRLLCREWGARAAFRSGDHFSLHTQYTDTPAGTFFCVTQIQVGGDDQDAVTVGVRFSDSRIWRGRHTDDRTSSSCPDPGCCREPSGPLSQRWADRVVASPRSQNRIIGLLAPDPQTPVDKAEMYEFLERHSAKATEPPT